MEEASHASAATVISAAPSRYPTKTHTCTKPTSQDFDCSCHLASDLQESEMCILHKVQGKLNVNLHSIRHCISVSVVYY